MTVAFNLLLCEQRGNARLDVMRWRHTKAAFQRVKSCDGIKSLRYGHCAELLINTANVLSPHCKL